MKNFNIHTIDAALKSNPYDGKGGTYFHLDAELLAIIEKATELGFVRRLSHTQAEWTEEGIEAARRLGDKRAVRVTVKERSFSGWTHAFVAVNEDGLFGFLSDNLNKPYMPVGGREALAGAWDSLIFRKWNADGYTMKRPVRIK